MCHCSDTGVDRTLNKSQHTKLTLEKKKSPADQNSQPFNHESGAVTNKISWLQEQQQHCRRGKSCTKMLHQQQLCWRAATLLGRKMEHNNAGATTGNHHKLCFTYAMSMSKSICRMQSDSMHKPHACCVWHRWKSGREGGMISGRRHIGKGWGMRGRGWGGGDKEITQLKTNVISAATEKKQSLLLGEACLKASRGWVLHCEMTLLLNIFSCVLVKSRH